MFRLCPRTINWGKMSWDAYEPQIMYKGFWYDLARTSLSDDIRTGDGYDLKTMGEKLKKLTQDDVDKARKFWIDKARYGARIADPYFHVIDSWSDG